MSRRTPILRTARQPHHILHYKIRPGHMIQILQNANQIRMNRQKNNQLQRSHYISFEKVAENRDPVNKRKKA
jgi:hypothetical protein